MRTPSLPPVPLAAVVVALLTGCPDAGAPPEDGPVFPTGLALVPDGSKLIVVASNYNLAFGEGRLLVADLDKARTALTGEDAVVTDAYVASALLPSFGDRPVLTANGEHLYVATRETNLISSVDVTADGLACTGATSCAAPPRALQLPANDPFDVLLTDDAIDADGAQVRAGGMISVLSSSRVFFFSEDYSRDDSERMTLRGSLDLGLDIAGVRSMVLRPARNGSPRLAFAAVDVVGGAGALLLRFEPRVDAVPESVDVTALTGSVELRDVVLVPGDAGVPDALIVALRTPDALARFEIDDDAGALPRLVALEPSCRQPTGLALASVAAPVGTVTRVLLTCQEDQVVEALEPETLSPTDAVRFFGRGPYDVVVTDATTPPQAYVSFFLDNSVGVIDLADGAGNAKMVIKGRIGTPLPRPEDGRE